MVDTKIFKIFKIGSKRKNIQNVKSNNFRVVHDRHLVFSQLLHTMKVNKLKNYETFSEGGYKQNSKFTACSL